MSTLNLTTHILAFDDLPASNNPQRKRVDRRVTVLGIPVADVRDRGVTKISALQETLIFDGTRTLTLDNTTELTLSLTSLDATRYRLAWTGTGTTPGFRTNRNLTLSGANAILALSSNQTMVVTYSGAPPFGTVQVGDVVFIPGVSTGDTGPFNSLNEGVWNVLAASASQLTIGRVPGSIFTGASETVAVTDNKQFQAYAATGVQVGDKLDLVGGFSTAARHSYNVVAVTATRVDFSSTLPLANETVVPGAANVKLYSDAQRYIYLETDQEIVVKCNGDTSETNRVEPIQSGDSALIGKYEKTGTVYSLSIKNRSAAQANVLVITSSW